MSTQQTVTTSGKGSGKRRAPMSCDRCKSRKTKCVDPVPGPCKFCASINAVCHLDPSRRRQRPYYHVSEEEFRYMTKALEHFLPNVELNLQSLREIVQSFDASAASAASAVSTSAGLHAPMDTAADQPCASASDASSDSLVLVGDNHSSSPTFVSGSCVKLEDKCNDSAVSIEEIDELHGELGWLRVDSRGTYRHVGVDSGYTFHAAVRSLRQRRQSEAAKCDVVPPFTAVPPLPPPSTPGSSAGSSGMSPGTQHHHFSGSSNLVSQQPQPQLTASLSAGVSSRRLQIYLPRRDLCNRCVSRFFCDVQSVYWFMSAERFYAILDRLYAGDPTSATAATLCSLYAILALTCESEAQAVVCGHDGEKEHSSSAAASAAGALADPPPAARYLSLAKTLVPALCDDADIDSVRALCLLGLALQSSLFSNTAYIYIGAAARIALTLGLHLPKTIESKGFLQRQVDLRLYSTLFMLDLDVALCYGNPPAISEGHVVSKVHGLAEQILGPGSHMPLEYLTVSCELIQIKRRLSRLLYGPNATNAAAASSSSSVADTRPSISAVTNVLDALHQWYTSIPPHLCDVARAAPFHQRSVSVLHLRYWSATIFATRPFLLYSALHPANLASLPVAKRASFEKFCTTCVDAASKSLQVMDIMHKAGLLSSLVALDSSCVIEVLQVFLLALARDCSENTDHQSSNYAQCADQIRACLHILQGMEQIFWTRHVLTEVMVQLEEHGLLNGDHSFSPQGDTPGNFFLDISQQQQSGIMSGVMEAYFTDLIDPLFAMQDNGSSSAEPMIGAPFDALERMDSMSP